MSDVMDGVPKFISSKLCRSLFSIVRVSSSHHHLQANWFTGLFIDGLGGGERGLMHLVPAPAVKLMKSRVLSRPGVKKVEVRWCWVLT
jgi:hypothetical protein